MYVKMGRRKKRRVLFTYDARTCLFYVILSKVKLAASLDKDFYVSEL